MGYLLDTNIISELAKKQPNKLLVNWFHSTPDHLLYLSVLSLGEIRKGVEQITDKIRKEKLRLWLENDIPNWFGKRILPIDEAVAHRWGELLGKNKMPFPAIDSLLAATALHYELRFVTRNMKDFPFKELEIINPWQF